MRLALITYKRYDAFGDNGSFPASKPGVQRILRSVSSKIAPSGKSSKITLGFPGAGTLKFRVISPGMFSTKTTRSGTTKENAGSIGLGSTFLTVMVPASGNGLASQPPLKMANADPINTNDALDF